MFGMLRPKHPRSNRQPQKGPGAEAAKGKEPGALTAHRRSSGLNRMAAPHRFKGDFIFASEFI